MRQTVSVYILQIAYKKRPDFKNKIVIYNIIRGELEARPSFYSGRFGQFFEGGKGVQEFLPYK